MKNSYLIILILFFYSCSDIIPELQPIDNSVAGSDKIYLSHNYNLNQVKVSNDGTLWAKGNGCFYSLKDGIISKHQNTNAYWGNTDFGIYKSGICYYNDITYNSNVFSILLNNTLTNYKYPYTKNYNRNRNFGELDDLASITEGYEDPLLHIYTFNETQWKSHSFGSLTNDYQIITGSRYNYVFKSNLSSDIILYNPIDDKEVNFKFNYTNTYGYPVHIDLSENCIDSHGNIYTVINNSTLVTFNYSSSQPTSASFNITGISNPSFRHLFVDYSNNIWYLGSSGSAPNKIFFAYNLNTKQFVQLYTDVTGYDEPNIYVDKNNSIWIYDTQSGNTKIQMFENGTLKNSMELQGNEIAFIKSDNNKNFWFGVWNLYGSYPQINVFCYKKGKVEAYNDYFIYETQDY